METQRCNKCGTIKDVDSFYFYAKRNYRNKICKACKSADQKRNPNRIANKTKYRNSEKGRTAARKSVVGRHGLSIDEYDSMMDSQGGRCLVCGSVETATYRGAIRALSVDHCHSSGKIRGLLCDNCNTILGRVKDSPDHLQNLINYLEERG